METYYFWWILIVKKINYFFQVIFSDTAHKELNDDVCRNISNSEHFWKWHRRRIKKFVKMLNIVENSREGFW